MSRADSVANAIKDLTLGEIPQLVALLEARGVKASFQLIQSPDNDQPIWTVTLTGYTGESGTRIPLVKAIREATDNAFGLREAKEATESPTIIKQFNNLQDAERLAKYLRSFGGVVNIS